MHPSSAAYRVIADGLFKDITNPEARYTNPPKTVLKQQHSKKPRLDLSLERDAWVSGCTAALPRRDSAVPPARGAPSRGGNPRGLWKRRNTNHSGSSKRGYVHSRGGWGRGRGRGRGHLVNVLHPGKGGCADPVNEDAILDRVGGRSRAGIGSVS